MNQELRLEDGGVSTPVLSHRPQPSHSNRIGTTHHPRVPLRGGLAGFTHDSAALVLLRTEWSPASLVGSNIIPFHATCSTLTMPSDTRGMCPVSSELVDSILMYRSTDRSGIQHSTLRDGRRAHSMSKRYLYMWLQQTLTLATDDRIGMIFGMIHLAM